jgi:hypothetical protein
MHDVLGAFYMVCLASKMAEKMTIPLYTDSPDDVDIGQALLFAPEAEDPVSDVLVRLNIRQVYTCRYMSFSANKLHVSMTLPVSQFPFQPGSHERTSSELGADRGVTCELDSLGCAVFKAYLTLFRRNLRRDHTPTRFSALIGNSGCYCGAATARGVERTCLY